jgi:DNA-binding transcriptional MerR regulator
MVGKSDDWSGSGIQNSILSEEDEGADEDAGDESPTVVKRLTLSELTAAADVSVRTVRYYIAEGLLPPPEGSGPGSAYTQGHLDRLRLIQRLKEAYLPLKEIRRRLSGLNDEEVRSLLAIDENRTALVASPPSGTPYDESLAGARDYLALLESREQYRTEPMALQFPAAAARVEADQDGSDFMSEPARSRVAREPGPVISRLPQRDESVVSPGTGLWHRIPLGDEAELVISDRVYDRHRDRIDWLVRWARKVFG